MLIISKLIFGVVGIALIAIALFFYIRMRTYLNIPTIVNLFWGFMILAVPLVAPGINIPPFGVLYIFTCLLVFSAPAAVLNAYKKNNIGRVHVTEFNVSENALRLIVGLCILVSIISSIKIFYIFKIDPSLLISNLIAASGRLAALRGNSDISVGIWGILVANSAYLAAALLSFRKFVTPGYILLHLTPALIAAVLLSQKLILLIAIFTMLIMSAILKQVRFHGEQKVGTIRARQKTKYILLILFAVSSIFISFISREGYNIFSGEANVSKLFLALRSYSIGSIVSFSYFFDDYTGINWGGLAQIPQAHYYGRLGDFTFGGLKSSGIDTTYYIAAGHPEIVYSNIYTIFRGLIYDFGVLGGILFFHAIGVLVSLLMRRCTIGLRSGLLIACTYYLSSFALIGYLLSPAAARYTLLVSFELFILIGFFFPLLRRFG